MKERMNFCRFSCFIAGYSKSSLKISDSGLDRFNCYLTFLNYMYSLQRSVENVSYSLNKPRIFLLISFCRCTCTKGKHCDIVNFYFFFFFCGCKCTIFVVILWILYLHPRSKFKFTIWKHSISIFCT